MPQRPIYDAENVDIGATTAIPETGSTNAAIGYDHFSNGENTFTGSNDRSGDTVPVANLSSHQRTVSQQAQVSHVGNGVYGKVRLYEWQGNGVEWGIEGAKAGLTARLIGDSMRVGKTPTAIALDLELRKLIGRKQSGNNCTLIVCPKSVITHWAELLRSMGVPSGAICEVDLPRKQALREKLGHIGADKRKANASAQYVILNWDTVQTIRSELQRAGPFFHIIGDEIHRIKGRQTKRTESFKKLKAKQRTGLSGTPADNKPEDFWSVLNWLYPQVYSSYWNFVEKFCNVQVNRKTGYKYIDGVNWERLPELRESLRPFYIRRTLHEVAGSVPLKQRRTVEVSMGARQRREYDEMEKEGISEVEGGDVLTPLEIVKRVRLQQMAIGCCKVGLDGEVSITDEPKSPKLNWIEEYIRDEPESGPFIIFAQHQDTVHLMGARLREKGIQTSTLVGTDTTADRSTAVRRFRSGESTCFIGTIRACREGITLSEANTIIFTDRDWSANANRQAEARADSVNSDLPVTIITLESKGSIDQDRRLKIDAKAEATDAITATS